MQTPAQVREHYEIERELSDRLRGAGTREERRRLYGDVYRELFERVEHHPLVRQAGDAVAQRAAVAPQVELLRHFVGGSTDFCEIGAGDGAVARALAPHVKRSLAFDVTDAYMHGPNPEGRFEFRVFDGFDPGLPAASIDFVYSRDVVEHLHPEDMLEQTAALARALRPGGMYLCVTPNRLTGPHDVSRAFDPVPTGFHLREYSSAELAAVMRRAGFSRTRIVLSMGGRLLSPRLPLALATGLEWGVARLPAALRQRLASPLAAVKVLGIR